MPRSLPVNQIAPVGVGTDPLGLAYPLNEFYRRNGHSLPPLEEIDPARIPEPYKSLLVHQHDMTSTLENFYGGRIRLQIVGRQRQGIRIGRDRIVRVCGRHYVRLIWLRVCVRLTTH